eukprot:TRINITY_DN3992_c0_g6_i2.p1 TRINITY_DN3992_c0_g6~~TRINITY_DN3992_c0_g6_i2.p1  ORF type:complete len:344 (-),score=75.69 TRINITY_DN3992_c0_g6_i2:26-1033(-)
MSSRLRRWEVVRDIFKAIELTCPWVVTITLRCVMLPVFFTISLVVAGDFLFGSVRLRNVKKTGSATSVLVCLTRALGHLYGICDDDTAVDMIPLKDYLFSFNELIACFIFGRCTFLMEVVGRSIYGDRISADAKNQGFEQIVLLGAGHLTRLHRMNPNELPARLFEVDAPITQKDKVSRLRKFNPNVVFVAVDFETQSWLDELEKNGFDRTKKTLFFWEGVCYYLTIEAIRLTLESIGTCAKGSKLVMDIFTIQTEVIPKIILHLMGEPFLNPFTTAEIESLLKEYNLEIQEIVRGLNFEFVYHDSFYKHRLYQRNGVSRSRTNDGLYFISATLK